MHWELHPTERPAHSQIPWFWVPASEIYPQLISIATVSEVIPELRRAAGESLDAMFQVLPISNRIDTQLLTFRRGARNLHCELFTGHT